jgi:LmbE family N-acetylglucosaminyl deacetylase
VILAVSPHLDDAVFSAGAWLATQEDVVVATVFTASVPDPQGFALACQTDKGIAPDVDYMALRRAEDERACAAIGARAVHLGLPEAPHRGYDSAGALFGGVRPGDAPPVAEALAPWLARADVVLGPAGVGGHADHLLVREALPSGTPLWLDQPYGLRHGAEEGEPLPPGDVEAKLRACSAYASQLGFQFGSEAAMRQALRPAVERLTARA